MDIGLNIKEIKESLPEGTRLVAVSKTKTIEDIMEAYHAGQRIFGENKVQELVQKYEKLPKDIQWHMIGHLQTNKVKYIAPFVDMIHSVDSLKLLKILDSEAKKNNRVIKILLQVYIATEETKFGFEPEEADQLIASGELAVLSNIKLAGLMGMASFTDNAELIASEFFKLQHLFKILKQKYFQHNPEFKELSIGMSSDYAIALKFGSTLVRIGSSIFGIR